jgi:hypothetical protein
MIDMPMGDEQLFDGHALLTKAPLLVAVHQSSVQFCCKGVTGIIVALSGGMVMLPDVAKRRVGRKALPQNYRPITVPAPPPPCRTARLG